MSQFPPEAIGDPFLAARLSEREARTRWYSTLRELQSRTTATGIATLAIDELSDRKGEIAAFAWRKMMGKSTTVTTIVGAVALFLFRKPIARALDALISPRRATGAADYPLDAQLDVGAAAMPNLNPAPSMIEET